MDGLADIMSYWTFSDVFEEQGVVKTPFYGGFGLLAERDIPKAVFQRFRIAPSPGRHSAERVSDSLLVTRRKDGSLAIPPGISSFQNKQAPPRTSLCDLKA